MTLRVRLGSVCEVAISALEPQRTGIPATAQVSCEGQKAAHTGKVTPFLARNFGPPFLSPSGATPLSWRQTRFLNLSIGRRSNVIVKVYFCLLFQVFIINLKMFTFEK